MKNSFKIKYIIQLYRPVLLLTALILLLTISGCKKLVNINPPITGLSGESVFTTDATAIAAVTGIYTKMANSSFANGQNDISVLSGLSSDEFSLFNGTTGAKLSFYTNSLTAANTAGLDYWSAIYPFIYTANSAIEGLLNNSNLTPAVKQQLLGESKFVRAFCYFYLVNFYGDVPLVVTTDYKTNATLSRTNQNIVMQQIIADLKDAQGLLSSNYLSGTFLANSTERERPTTFAATALLSRVYLYAGDWQNAADQSSVLINNSTLFKLSTLPKAFLKFSLGNQEAIWQLQPTNTGSNTADGPIFILPSGGPTSNSIYLSNNLIGAFENGDQRLVNWTGNVTVSGIKYYYPFKYKVNLAGSPVTEYIMVFRLGEQYLIRAEAEANGAIGGTAAAIIDLNVIRIRAGLANYGGATDKTSVLAAVLKERRIELFSEWGHRWLDLKRTNNLNSVMGSITPQKGGVWSPNWQLYPIVVSELQADVNLSQNPGY